MIESNYSLRLAYQRLWSAVLQAEEQRALNIAVAVLVSIVLPPAYLYFWIRERTARK